MDPQLLRDKVKQKEFLLQFLKDLQAFLADIDAGRVEPVQARWASMRQKAADVMAMPSDGGRAMGILREKAYNMLQVMREYEQ